MAKLSAINNNLKKRKLSAAAKVKRASLADLIKDKLAPFDQRIAAVHKLAEMPRNSSLTRVRNRCLQSGRPRAFYRKFNLSRIALRELGNLGMIPGVVKSSW
jgi:small subunit ribosomal protein S14